MWRRKIIKYRVKTYVIYTCNAVVPGKFRFTSTEFETPDRNVERDTSRAEWIADAFYYVDRIEGVIMFEGKERVLHSFYLNKSPFYCLNATLTSREELIKQSRTEDIEILNDASSKTFTANTLITYRHGRSFAFFADENVLVSTD